MNEAQPWDNAPLSYTPLQALLLALGAYLPENHVLHRLGMFDGGGMIVGVTGSGKSVMQDLMVMAHLAKDRHAHVDVFPSHWHNNYGLAEFIPAQITSHNSLDPETNRPDWPTLARKAGLDGPVEALSIHAGEDATHLETMLEGIAAKRLWCGFQHPDYYRYIDVVAGTPFTRQFRRALIIWHQARWMEDEAYQYLGLTDSLIKHMDQVSRRCRRLGLIVEYDRLGAGRGQAVAHHVVDMTLPREVMQILGPVIHHNPLERENMKRELVVNGAAPVKNRVSELEAQLTQTQEAFDRAQRMIPQ